MIELEAIIEEAQTLEGCIFAVPAEIGSGNSTDSKTYMLVMEDGTEIPAVEVGEETVFTATANDIRAGTVAATAEGVTEGTKEIPAYNTSAGYKVITAGSAVAITNLYNCEYTKLQVLVCAFNSSIANSVATEKVSIDGKVYAVGNTTVLATVTVDAENKKINLGITNEGSTPLIVRYITYKEIY